MEGRLPSIQKEFPGMEQGLSGVMHNRGSHACK